MDFEEYSGNAECPKCKRIFEWSGSSYEKVMSTTAFDEYRKSFLNCDDIKKVNGGKISAYLCCPYSNCKHSFEHDI